MISYTWLRNLNVEEAKTMMIETLRWREEFNIEAAMNETYPDIFDGFGHLYGRDKEGRPIWYAVLLYRAHSLLNLVALVAITFMEGITTSRRPLVMSSGLFGEQYNFFFLVLVADLPAPKIQMAGRIDGARH